MKKIFKTLIICTLSINLFAQSTLLDPNKVNISNQYELFASTGSNLELRRLGSNFGPMLTFINNPTSSIRDSIGSFNTPSGTTNTFGLLGNTTIGRTKANEIQYKQDILHKSFGTSITNQRIELFNQSYANKITVETSDLIDESGTQVLLQINI